MENKEEIIETIESDIMRYIRQVNFGEVIITIHNSKIVQIERREKKRYTH
ncbi:MAG TPA: YezD family protein [Syntrophorhabdaceae bacterium]|jgi:hypothetical protein|nr:YezD family protein [Syntrophorhabdaceae bacterium]MDI9561191.1 YezD family protein [Pseudomonadota bacterium]OQC47874.1 MAG: hypothetical protein BWX58_01379 [Deltaproteobacteria bacterium ADurb.Bin026]MBP8697487.1 YezD family protein [Syntrophorhabdaceae bacterium]MBV6504863.1 hypothetical protein [Syntrophorhabdaceae bacterium]